MADATSPNHPNGAMGSLNAAGEGVRKLSRTVRRPLDQSNPLSLAAGSNGLASTLPNRGFDHRTKMERLATILLPNLVVAHDTERGEVDGPAKILKENSTVPNRPSLAEMAVTEFRVRCLFFTSAIGVQPSTRLTLCKLRTDSCRANSNAGRADRESACRQPSSRCYPCVTPTQKPIF